MLKKILFLLILGCYQSIFAQENSFELLNDTTIYFDELTFNSDLEKEKFQSIYFDKDTDYFSLFFVSRKGANTSKVKSSKRLMQDQIDLFKSKNKDDKKQIKWIYKKVHDEFFKKYELENHFDDVFEKGYYNCLSSTAIYSMILEELDIPYQINILPNHVNLTAYPNTHKILIESTDPITGYISYDRKFKEDYVTHLIDFKLIEPKDIELKSVEAVFDEYYKTNEAVNLKQLVGVQYYNDGLYLMNNEKLEASIEQFEKSIALYPSINTARILLSIYSKKLYNSDYADEKDFKYLIRASRYKQISEDFDQVIESEFGRIADDKLLKERDTTLFMKMYANLSPLVTKEKTKVRIDYIYAGAMGDYHLKELNFKKASDYFLEALELVGDTHNLEEFYIKSVVYQISDKNDMEESLLLLNNAEKRYEPIKDNKIFLTAKAEVITLLMMRSFERNKIKAGEEYREMLEAILDNNEVKRNENNIGIAYAQAGSAYFRLGSRTKAKALFKKGLIYSPGNYELEYRLSMVNY